MSEELDPRFLAAVELLGRTGAENFQIRYSDDEEPVIWIAAAKWPEGTECAAALEPTQAAVRLLERVIDGGVCMHCERPTGVSDDFATEMPLSEHVCWYIYDPELKTFRRGCEGD